mmetsp:Transcript_18586/g.37619  ORF Transcript_18586/g.37619 Transcript_18586/m.37619 type:complete len:99 (-) Transcript_18586:501-797(-)
MCMCICMWAGQVSCSGESNRAMLQLLPTVFLLHAPLLSSMPLRPAPGSSFSSPHRLRASLPPNRSMVGGTRGTSCGGWGSINHFIHHSIHRGCRGNGQ